MPRLLVYTDATSFGGAEASLGNLIGALHPDIETAVLGTDATIVDAIAARRPSTPTHLVPPVRDKRDLGPIVAHVRALRRLRPDICQLNLRTPYSCQYGLLAAHSARGVRVVAVEHLPFGTQHPVTRWLKRLSSRPLAAHVAVGEHAARLIEQEARLRAGSVRTIYNGVPDDRIERLPRLAEGLVVGSVGRLDEQKAYDVLIAALPSLPDVTVVLVGDGPARAKLEELARHHGVADRVIFTGWQAEARRYLGGFDVFVLPSRYEGFPLSIIEAMLACLPVVATDVGSVSECVLAGETGAVVPPDDGKRLAETIWMLLESADLRMRMGEQGRERAISLFSVDAMARSYEQLYAEILA
jgi:glycosyltransferase involved in cell wall biosynthesis